MVSSVVRLSLWASHSLITGRSVVFLSSTVSSPVSSLCSVCDLSPPYFRTALKVRQQPPSAKTTINHESLLTFTLSFLFFPDFGINSLTLFNLILPSRPSKQLFTTTYRPPSKSSIFSTPDNPPKPTSFKLPAFLPESPCSVHLVYPMFPTSSLSLPQIS